MRSLVIGFLLSILVVSPGFTASDNSRFNEYLTLEKSNLIQSQEQIQQAIDPVNSAALAERQQQNQAMQTLIQGKISSLNDFLADQRKQQQNLNHRLKKLQEMPLVSLSNAPVLDERINQIHQLEEEINNTIELIDENLSLAKTYNESLLAEQARLSLLQANMGVQQQQEQLRERIARLKLAQDELYQSNVELQKNKKNNPSPEERLNYEAQVMLNNQNVVLLQHQVIELELEKKQISMNYLLLKNQDIKTIQSVTDFYKQADKNLLSIEASLKNMQTMLVNKLPLLAGPALKQKIAMQKNIDIQLQQVSTLQKNVETELEANQELLTVKLASRQSLAEYHINSWPHITGQLLQIPVRFYHYIKLLTLKIQDNYIRESIWSMVLQWSSLLLIITVGIMLRRGLRAIFQSKERSNITSGHFYDVALELLYRNIPHLTAITSVIMMFFLNHVLLSNYHLLINLFLVWLTFRNLILIVRLAILTKTSDSLSKNAKLYERLFWLFIVGGWSTALMVFAHQLPLGLVLQDIFNRLFMLFLLTFSLVAWSNREAISYLLLPLIYTQKRYLRNAISLLVILVPLTLLTTAIIGFVGYIDLAWTLSRYQAYLLLVITGYVLMRGLVLDVLNAMTAWMSANLANGWLWIDVVIKPLRTVTRVTLMVLFAVILFAMFGWTTDSEVVAVLVQIGRYPFVDLSGIRITLFNVLKFAVLLFVLVWFATWTREFCYRWLYRKVPDPGIRNSLSVFTQYAIIALGGLLTLRVLGVDFSGMAIVFGGLAVGMGFGLRDFASNIVGGLMLLIERPVREGDLITIGEHEGRVAHIGIRSMRVSSWDNMEVLIPNAETFNKSFTNWTHQDYIIRTVVPIKVSREDDPCVVQQLIMDVLVIIPEVLREPIPQVLLTQIDEVLIGFEVRYFINVQHHTRFEIRSKVLFAIMAQFKAAGIKSPIPSLQVGFNRDDSKTITPEE